jgi:hypothetical protein
VTDYFFQKEQNCILINTLNNYAKTPKQLMMFKTLELHIFKTIPNFSLTTSENEEDVMIFIVPAYV